MDLIILLILVAKNDIKVSFRPTTVAARFETHNVLDRLKIIFAVSSPSV
jgi:hypothetical protein